MTDIVERISQLPELANLPGGALAADCFEAAVEIKKLRAENEKLRTATTELLSHYYDAMRRDGYADEEVRSEHVFLAAAAALKETE